MFGSDVATRMASMNAQQKVDTVLSALQQMDVFVRKTIQNGQQNFTDAVKQDLDMRDVRVGQMYNNLGDTNALLAQFPGKMTTINALVDSVMANKQVLANWMPVAQGASDFASATQVGAVSSYYSQPGAMGRIGGAMGRNPMTTALVIGGVALGGWLLYKKFMG